MLPSSMLHFATRCDARTRLLDWYCRPEGSNVGTVRAWPQDAPFSTSPRQTLRRGGLAGVTGMTNSRVTASLSDIAFSLLGKALDEAGPSAVDILAHGRAGFGAHDLELVMHELDVGSVWPISREAHVDL
jgi:hypothetical protein